MPMSAFRSVNIVYGAVVKSASPTIGGALASSYGDPVPYLACAALCGLTLVSVTLVEEGWWRWSAPIMVTVIAAIKARLVVVHYMEAHRARRVWRVLYGAWIFAAAATIIGAADRAARAAATIAIWDFMLTPDFMATPNTSGRSQYCRNRSRSS